MALVGSLMISLAAKTDQLEKDMAKARGEIGRLKASVEDSQKSFGGLESSFAGFGKSLVGIGAGVVALGTLKSAISDVIKTGIEMQSLRTSFAVISGGAAEGAKQFQYVVSLADKLGSSFTDLASSYKGITAAAQGTSLAGDKAKQIFEAVSTAGRTLGLSNENVQGTLLAVQQMMSKGTVQSEELRGQLGERLPGAFAIAARAMGVTTAELGKMLEGGKVLSEDFLPKFAAQLKKELGGGAQEAANTAGAAFNRLENEWKLLKTRIANSGPLQLVAVLAGSGAALLTGGTKADAALTKEAGRLLGKGGTDAQMEQMKNLIRPESGFGGEDLGMAGVSSGRSEATKAAIRRLQAQAGFGRIDAAIGTGKPTAFDTSDAGTDAVIKKSAEVAKTLDETNKKLEDQAALNKLAPELLGNSTDAAKRKVAGLNEDLKIQKEQLESIAKLAISANGVLTEQQQKDVDTLRGKIRTGESAVKAVEDAEAAKRKAESDAEAAKRKAEQDAEAARRKAEQEEADLARNTMQRLREITAEEDRNIEALRTMAGQYGSVTSVRDADTASMLKAQLVTSQYANEAARLAQTIADVQKVEAQLPDLRAAAERSGAKFEANRAGNTSLDRYEELLNIGPSKATRQYLKAKDDLQGKDLDPARVEQVLKRLEPEFIKLKDSATEFADSFLATIDRATTGGIKSFKDFVGSVIQDMARILQQNYLKPFVGKLIEQGISLGITALGGGGVAASTAPTSAGLQTAGSFASGGDVRQTGWQMVGENGPERVWLNKGDHVYANGAGSGSVNVNFTVYAQDAGSFKRSEGEIRGRLLNTIRGASRDG